MEQKQQTPLRISCTSADCDNNLHCFKQLKKMTKQQRGQCRYCGADLIDWDRVHVRNFEDVEYTFSVLKHEMIRHSYFHRPIDELAVRHAMRKGRIKLNENVENRITKNIAPAFPARDGYQTPYAGNVIYYGQHATATCCRGCLKYWHGISKGKELARNEIEYCVGLLRCFLDERLPGLSDYPLKVPNLRQDPRPIMDTINSPVTDC